MIQGTPEPITTSVVRPVAIDPVPIDEDTILADVVGMLVEVIGDDFLLEGEVTTDTSFGDDLAVDPLGRGGSGFGGLQRGQQVEQRR